MSGRRSTERGSGRGGGGDDATEADAVERRGSAGGAAGADIVDWVDEVVDRVAAEAAARGAGTPLVCASGVSPSGPVHLGNLRELLVPHFVSDELRRRGLPASHLLSWDDYDRLRKIPDGVPASFAEFIGCPLTSVPDPCEDHENWAEHFKAPLRASLLELGVEVREISQTQRYRAGAYTNAVLRAVRSRSLIDRILARHRTAPGPGASQPAETADQEDAAAEAVESAGDNAPGGVGYFPYKPYCDVCGRDSTRVTAWDDSAAVLRYSCSAGHTGEQDLTTAPAGKLVWKVDWPMRWAHEHVLFEAGGVDHSSPGSSFTVGSQLVRDVFGGTAPVYLGYSFVGTRGAAKLSGSAGGAPTPGDALEVLEPPLLRWVYARRRPAQAITVSFDQELVRLHDEWDSLAVRVGEGIAHPWEGRSRERAASTAAGPLPVTPRPMPFRTLASVVDVTSGDPDQELRILRELTPEAPVTSLAEVRPRLDRATAWVTRYVPPEDRTVPRVRPDLNLLATLDPVERASVNLLLAELGFDWSLQGLTALVYRVPRQQLGLSDDAPRTPALKQTQRAFFAVVYRLLLGRDTGPRLPTLLLCLGQNQVRALLRDPDGNSGAAA